MKLSTYVLILSPKFPHDHIDAGKGTLFFEKKKAGTKIHTIRQNYAEWKRRVDRVNEGKGIISIREWSGKPYCSNQIILEEITKIGIQKLDLTPLGWFIDDYDSDITGADLATNDGLTRPQFNDWFRHRPIEDYAILHFTDFRYENSYTCNQKYLSSLPQDPVRENL